MLATLDSEKRKNARIKMPVAVAGYNIRIASGLDLLSAPGQCMPQEELRG